MKMFTFHFTYSVDDRKIEETEFCAYSKDEAEELFWDFILEEYSSKKGIDIRDVDVVYNEDDEYEYGINYGTPEEYRGDL